MAAVPLPLLSVPSDLYAIALAAGRSNKKKPARRWSSHRAGSALACLTNPVTAIVPKALPKEFVHRAELYIYRLAVKTRDFGSFCKLPLRFVAYGSLRQVCSI